MMPPYPLSPPFLFAPLEGIGDRIFLEELDAAGGAGALFTRFLRVTATGGVTPPLSAFLPWPGKTPLVVQFLGRDPGRLAEAAARAAALGAAAVDLNFGCPSATVAKRGGGAALLDEPERIRAIVRAVRAALPGTPLSVKMRLGVTTRDAWRTAAAACAGEGADLVILHGRTAAMGYDGSADWGAVAEAARTLPVPVCGNGDIATAGEAARRLEESGCAAVMIGRAAVADPWIFRRAAAIEPRGAGAEPRQPDPLVAHHRRLLERFTRAFRGEAMALARLKAHAAHLDRLRLAPAGIDATPLFRARTGEEYLDRLERLLDGV